MLLASDMIRAPTGLRFIFVLAVESEATDRLLFDEFMDKLRDQGDNDDAVRQQIDPITRSLTSTVWLSSDEVGVSDLPATHHSPLRADLSLKQIAVARQISDTNEQHSQDLIFVQANAGTGKIHNVRVILSELPRRHIDCLICATIGIAAMQYPGG
jgi:hypothetical protein